MDGRISALFEIADRRPGATEAAIDQVRAYAELELPKEYLDFLRSSNGAEGQVGRKGYVHLFAAEEIPKLDEGFGLREFLPGFLLVGSDGGGEAIAIDTRSNDPLTMEYVVVPFIGLDIDDICFRSGSLYDLLRHIARGGLFSRTFSAIWRRLR